MSGEGREGSGVGGGSGSSTVSVSGSGVTGGDGSAVGGSGRELTGGEGRGSDLKCFIFWYGVIFFKNFLFRSVILPEPSTLTIYWSCSLTSTTTPVMSHLDG